ncbi:MAG: TetR/AcrR family transcriptional regulator [Pseudonocardia sp.]|nr:TetR/AcrR family transcriptional regulator [Pseudonocardia sp.]
MARTVDPERTRARRDAISSAAADLFATKGFDHTTAAEIARAAGLSSGSVFYYFADKRAVFRSIFEADLPASREMVARHAEGTDPLGSILAMVDELGGPAQDPSASGILIELLRQIDHDVQLQIVIAQTTEVIRGGLVALVERGQASGVLDPELDPTEAAAWIQNIVDGAFLSADPERDPRPMLRRIVARFLSTPPSTQGGNS